MDSVCMRQFLWQQSNSVISPGVTALHRSRPGNMPREITVVWTSNDRFKGLAKIHLYSLWSIKHMNGWVFRTSSACTILLSSSHTGITVNERLIPNFSGYFTRHIQFPVIQILIFRVIKILTTYKHTCKTTKSYIWPHPVYHNESC